MKLPNLPAVAMALAVTCLPDVTLAQPSGAPPSVAGPTDRAALRFPQPVRVGDLSGRTLLGPGESQPVLGRITGTVRHADGRTSVVVRLAGWFAARSVAVPVEAVGLLGEFVALLDITPEQLRALPTFEAASASVIPPDQAIRVGLVKPFH